MFIHIGKELILEKNSIIGIFNINTIKDTIEYKNIINKLEEENKLKDISKENKKTFILYKKQNNLYGVISNISSNAIGKRSLIKD